MFDLKKNALYINLQGIFNLCAAPTELGFGFYNQCCYYPAPNELFLFLPQPA